jgi:3-oxoacyl-[acyl-carrier protein] reductase
VIESANPGKDLDPTMRVDLTGKVALVTGAARGIGQAIADLLATNGAQVAYSDLTAEDAQKAASARQGCRGLRLDVTDAASVEEGLAEVVRHFGRLDILVNNAGVNTLDHRVPIDQFPQSEWNRLLQVDLTGVFLVSRAGAQVMLKQASGRIINITSVAGLVPLRLQCAFVAAKAGVVNLTRAMALELGSRGVLVNAVAPGSTLTEGTRRLFYGADGKYKESVQQLLAHIPLGRPARPEEIAHAVLFLAAPESSYVNGAILTVDGGWTAGYLRDF